MKRHVLRKLAAVSCVAVAFGALAMAVFVATGITLEYGHNVGVRENVLQISLIIGAALLLVTFPLCFVGFRLWRSGQKKVGT